MHTSPRAGSRNVVLRPATLVAPVSLLQVQIHGSHSHLLNQSLQGVWVWWGGRLEADFKKLSKQEAGKDLGTALEES